jgi:SAM-dependent methyltransferase
VPDDIDAKSTPAPIAFSIKRPGPLRRLTLAVRRLVGADREKRWNRQYADGGWRWLRKLDELAHYSVLAGYVARLKPGSAVLDVGCGEGILQEELRGCYATYVGCDFGKAVRQAAAKADGRTAFVEADMNFFAPAGKFGVIIFNESAYYLTGIEEGLRRYESFLEPDGVLLISMHGKPRNDALWEQIHRRYTILDEVAITNRHGTRWNVKALVPPGSTFTRRD